MSIPNCPYCGKKMMIERVSWDDGCSAWSAIHENEEEGERCGHEFARFRSKKEAETNYKLACYYAEEC